MPEFTDWSQILEDEELRFDESKLDLEFLRGLTFGLSVEQVERIDAKLEKALKIVDRKQRIIAITNIVISMAKAGMRFAAMSAGVPLPK